MQRTTSCPPFLTGIRTEITNRNGRRRAACRARLGDRARVGGYSENVLQRRLLSICVVTSSISVAMLAAYRFASGSSDLDYLFWNLALAWVPLVAALALDDVRSTPLSLQLPLIAIWLAFFPNAPYLVTDLIHIDPQDTTTIGILGDAALVSVAPVGLALGFSSLMLVERTV